MRWTVEEDSTSTPPTFGSERRSRQPTCPVVGPLGCGVGGFWAALFHTTMETEKQKWFPHPHVRDVLGAVSCRRSC